MPDQGDVRRVALSLPGAQESMSSFEFRVNGRLFVWAWRERIEPKKSKVPSREVIVVAVRDEMDKQTLLAADIAGIFTERHYDGWPDILVRLADVDPAMLERLITDSYELAVAKGPPKPRGKPAA
jgi:hypothetical protein